MGEVDDLYKLQDGNDDDDEKYTNFLFIDIIYKLNHTYKPT